MSDSVPETDGSVDDWHYLPALYPGAQVYWKKVRFVGEGHIIGPGACIGQPGFGYAHEEDGSWSAKSHDYGVELGWEVEVGANTCIDRGSWRDTVIGDGTKIDNLVHIAHNVQIGKNVMVVAGAMIGGSVIVCDGAWIGLGAKINQRLVIGEGAIVGSGAVVVEDVPPGVVVAGVPARVLRSVKPDEEY